MLTKPSISSRIRKMFQRHCYYRMAPCWSILLAGWIASCLTSSCWANLKLDPGLIEVGNLLTPIEQVLVFGEFEDESESDNQRLEIGLSGATFFYLLSCQCGKQLICVDDVPLDFGLNHQFARGPPTL